MYKYVAYMSISNSIIFKELMDKIVWHSPGFQLGNEDDLTFAYITGNSLPF